MPYKLLSFVFLALFCVQQPDLYSQSVEVTEFGYRGKLQGLQSSRIQAWAIRPDGRYLFYATGGSSFRALDLQDGVTVGSEEGTASAEILALHMKSQTIVYALSSEGVESFNVTKPFKPEDATSVYERDSSKTVLDGCFDGDDRAYFLESAQRAADREVRITQNSSIVARVNWNRLFSSDPENITPSTIRCLNDGALVFATKSNREKLYIARVSEAGVVSASYDVDANYDDYKPIDFHLSTDNRYLLLLLKRRQSAGGTDDAIVLKMSSENLRPAHEVDLGADPQGLSVFLNGSDSMAGFFIGRDTLESRSNPPETKFLSTSLNALEAGADFGDRGVGSNSVGAFLNSFPFSSRWLFTNQDHYAYGLTESAGITLVSRAPYLVLKEGPGSGPFSQSSRIRFKIRSAEAIDYRIYFNNEPSEDGTQSGLVSNPGRDVLSGSMSASETKDFSIRLSSFGLTKIGKYSFIFTAKKRGAGTNSVNYPTARLGIPFEFYPDPKPVNNFRLGYGDQSVTVFFSPGERTDNLSHYYLYFSSQASDLEQLPTSETELRSSDFDQLENTFNLVGGGQLVSPKKIPADSWGGSIRLGPLPNGEKIYFRVQVVNKASKFSSNDPAALGESPALTKSLSQAFGSLDSCGARIEPGRSNAFVWGAFLLILGFLMLDRFRRAKKIGPSV